MQVPVSKMSCEVLGNNLIGTLQNFFVNVFILKGSYSMKEEREGNNLKIFEKESQMENIMTKELLT